MDPLSIPASVVGIVITAAQTIHLLSIAIKNIHDAPQAIQHIQSDLQALMPVLRQLEAAAKTDDSQLILGRNIEFVIQNCDRACRKFNNYLDRWTRHSTKDKTAFVDKVNIGLFQQGRINLLKDQLRDCKLTLTTTLETAIYLKAADHDQKLQDFEAILKNRISTLNNAPSAPEPEDGQRSSSQAQDVQEKEDLLEELQRQKASKAALLETCEEALQKVVEERTRQKIRRVNTGGNSVLLTGFVNAGGRATNVDQDISDVTTDGRSIAVTGIVNNVDVVALALAMRG